MNCVVCGQAETVDGLTMVMLERDEFRILVKSIPARLCPNCGEAYVEAAIAEQLLRIAAQTSEAGTLDTQREFRTL